MREEAIIHEKLASENLYYSHFFLFLPFFYSCVPSNPLPCSFSSVRFFFLYTNEHERSHVLFPRVYTLVYFFLTLSWANVCSRSKINFHPYSWLIAHSLTLTVTLLLTVTLSLPYSYILPLYFTHTLTLSHSLTHFITPSRSLLYISTLSLIWKLHFVPDWSNVDFSLTCIVALKGGRGERANELIIVAVTFSRLRGSAQARAQC